MKVSSVGGAKGISSSKTTKKSSSKGAEFAEQLREAAGTTEASGVVDSGAVAAVDSILAVQATGDATDERQRHLARQYGTDLLDRLDQIRADILAGGVPKERLANIAQMMRAQRRRTQDVRLNEILEEIELRAEVEIAKLTREV